MGTTTYIATDPTSGESLKVRAASVEAAQRKAAQIFADRNAGIVKRVNRNRETGTSIILVDRKLSGAPDDGQRWETICEDHATACSHDTREVATAFMAEPTAWCEDCQAAYSTDAMIVRAR